MKWLQILPLIPFVNEAGKPIKIDGRDGWKYSEWFDSVIKYEPAFGSGLKADRARKALPKAIRAAEDAGEQWCPIDDAWGIYLKNAVTTPETPPHPVVSVQCLPFAEASVALKDEQPAKVEPKLEAVPAAEPEETATA